MKRALSFQLVLGLIISGFLAGCGGESGVVFDSTVGDALPALVGAKALSNHYVEVTFTQPAGEAAENPANYTITAPDSSPLEVIGATVSDDRTQVILATISQEPVLYVLTVATHPGDKASPTKASNGRSNASFAGSTSQEPFLASAIALTNGSVLLTFSEAMDRESVGEEAHYRIEDPDQDPDIDIRITNVDVGQDRTTVTVSTTPQDNILYAIRVANIRSSRNSFLIDPTRSRATFFGIAANDEDGPRLLSAVSTSDMSVVLTFSEPLDHDAADPVNFEITCDDCPMPVLQVLDAFLTAHNTQIVLVTHPQTADIVYTVTVSNSTGQVTDLSVNRNPIDPDPSTATFTFGGQAAIEPGFVLPRVVGAISTGNTTVVVVFNKLMGDSALSASAYSIVQVNVNPEVGALIVFGNGCDEASSNAGEECASDIDCDGGTCLLRNPRFLGPDRTAVELTTTSQNEVTYEVTVVNVKDLAGNRLAPAEILVDPSKAQFAGTPPSGPEFVDSDGDGVTDNEELRGYVVVIRLTSGESIPIEVTSDPFRADTDEDGLDDLGERARFSNPRSSDTDIDLIPDFDEVYVWGTSLTNQDTDGDGIRDSSELNRFKTSPLFADTDGDGLDDGEEIPFGNRDPRISDLPDPGIEVGQVALRLDTRFAFTDTQGESTSVSKSTSATLAQSSSRTFSTSDSSTNQHAIQASTEFGGEAGGTISATPSASGKASFKVGFSYGYTRSDTFTASQSSTEQTQQQFQESLTTNVARDVTQAVTRTVEGASVEVLVTANNRGDIPFTIRNIELTCLLQDPYDRRTFQPIATLLPASVLDGGGEFEVFLGPFIPERGPFIFKSTQVFPSLVEDLMKAPRGLIFKVANFDIEDEEGRNFAFVTQDVNDRTTGLVFDFGNGAVERYRVSTHSRFDISECDGGSDNPGAFCRSDADCPGGSCLFSDARPVGVRMAFVLQDILRLEKNEPINAITVGPNGCGETSAVGDDIQVVVPICLPVPVGGNIIEPGPNGILDTIPVGDDKKNSLGTKIIDGGDGCAQTRASRDDVQVVPGDCETASPDGVMVRPGPDGVFQTAIVGDDQLATVTGYGTELVGTCNGETLRLIDPGQNGVLDTTPAGDDLESGTQILPGANGILESTPEDDDILKGPGFPCDDDTDCPGAGVCRDVERLTRVKGVENIPEENRFWIILTAVDIPPEVDFDDVILHSGDAFSLAFVQDKDGDGLLAREEFLYGSSDRDDNSDGCPLGDGDPGCDATVFDFDTVRDFDEVRKGWSVAVEGWRSYFAFPNPIQPDTDVDRLFDDEEQIIGSDPGKRDTDEDDISDFDEVRGYDIVRRDGELIRHVVPYQSARIGPGMDGVLDTNAVGDDVTGTDQTGRPIIAPGDNGIVDSTPDGDDVVEPTQLILDGGNGVPQTLAAGDDIQVGNAPTATTMAVTFLRFNANGNACDGLQSGEYNFDFLLRRNYDTLIGNFVEDAVVDPYTAHSFGPGNSFDLSVESDDSILISGTVRENDGVCDVDTRRVVIEPGLVIAEPLTGGNGFANSEVPTNQPLNDDIQEVALGHLVLPGQVIISPGLNGILDTIAPGGDDVIPVGNGWADTLATGDDEQVVELAQPAAAGEIIVSCGADHEPDMAMNPATPGICEAAGPDPARAPFACAAVIAQASGASGVAESSADPYSDDVQVISVGSAASAGAVIIGPGLNGFIDSTVASQVIVEPDAQGDGIANAAVAAGTDDIQVVLVGSAVSPGQLIIAPGPNGILDSPTADDDVIASSDDELIAAHVPAGLVCSTCPLGDCIVDCGLCPTGVCVGDDVLLVRQPGAPCDAFCPCGTCILGAGFDEWGFGRNVPVGEILEWVRITGTPYVVSFANGPDCFALSTVTVVIEVTGGIPSVYPGAVLVRPGPDTVLDTVPAGDDVVGAEHLTLFATDPLNRDTDADTLFDGAELALGANPNDPLDVSKFRDNDMDGLSNFEETEGWFVGFADENGLFCRKSNGDPMRVADEFNPPAECVIVTSDRFEPDTDFDGLPDLLEQLIRSDPRAEDTDGDGLLDLDEFDPGSRFSIDVSTAREFQRRCADAERCVFVPVEEPYGTSVVLADTDHDGRDDRAEIFDTWVIFPCIDGQQLPVEVSSDPLSPDADRDGVLDGDEEAQGTDPDDPDTDDDGKVDNLEVDEVPTGCGGIFTVTFLDYKVKDECEPGGDPFNWLYHGQFRFRLNISTPAKSFALYEANEDLDDNETHTFGSNQAVFLLLPGETFSIGGHVWEADRFWQQDWWFSRDYNYEELPFPEPNVTISPLPGEANDMCFSDHKLRVSITKTGA